MKVLKDILYKVSLVSTHGDMDCSVVQLAFDSRKVDRGTAFIAMKGTQVDGHQFIDQAVQKGATAVVCEVMPEAKAPNVTYVQATDTAKALGIMAANFYDHPSEKLKVVAITGTNGKTTIATLLHQLYLESGHSCGLLSTVENKINNEVLAATHT